MENSRTSFVFEKGLKILGYVETMFKKYTVQEGVEYVFGRGALDDKHSVIGILQALEEILKGDLGIMSNC